MVKQFGLMIITVLIVSVQAYAIDIYIPSDYDNILDAVSASVNGDVIWLADGTYTGDSNKNIYFAGKAITIKSENGPLNCVIDCQFSGNGFCFHDNETNNSVLEGITILNGGSDTQKSGIDIYSAAPTILNCVISNGTHGGITVSFGSTTLISDCVVRDNVSNDSSNSAGGIFINRGRVSIENCTITRNISATGTGGINYHNYATGNVLNCIISENISHAPVPKGGLSTSFFANMPTLIDCQIISNHGSGVYSDFERISISDCLIADNSTPAFGGGIYASYELDITKCVISGNSATKGGGIYMKSPSDSVIIGGMLEDQVLFSGNTASSGADIFFKDPPDIPINASFNIFTGCHESDFYVTPYEAFNLSECTSQLEPIVTDVYVSPAGSNSNNGLSSESPFKTIRYACSVINSTEVSPLTIHLAPGVYSPTTTGETFPVGLFDSITIEGSGVHETILDVEHTSQGITADSDTHVICRNLTVRNGFADIGSCGQHRGGGLSLYGSEVTLENCRLTENTATGQGGGCRCENSTLILLNSQIDTNISQVDGGGFYAKASTIEMFNCLVNENSCETRGSAGTLKSSTCVMTNLTVAGNNSSDDFGALHLEGNPASTTIINSILWNNTPGEISGNFDPSITYSTITDGYEGVGNLNMDPLFVTTATGSHYLSSTESGQAINSPCINAGNDDVATNCFDESDFCLNQTSTRTDLIADIMTVDMGYHYPITLESDILGCTIDMPDNDFVTGETCYCNLVICNPTLDHHQDIPVFAILGIMDTYFFAPSFSNYDHFIRDIGYGNLVINVIPEFLWPSDVSAFNGALFYGAMTNTEVSSILGEIDTFEFGWH